MESWLIVVLFVCLSGQALGFPQAIDSDTVLTSRFASGDHPSWTDQINKEGRVTMPLESQLLKRSPSEDEVTEDAALGKPALPDSSLKKMEEKKEPSDGQLRVLPDLTGDKLNFQLSDAARQAASHIEDNIRAKKSTSMEDMHSPHGPHTTTVCIQVRSDHQPRVVCGDPLQNDKKEGDLSTKARFAYRTPNDYYPHTYDQSYTDSQIQQGFFRVSPDMIPDRPMSQVPHSSMSPSQSPVLNHGPSSMRPKAAAARGPLPVSMFPLRRSEEETISPKIGDSTLPQAGGPGPTPIRINPPGIHPNSVIVHKQYYPYPQGYLPNLIGPSAPSPLRLNCATDGGYIPYLRSAQPAGYLPIEERLIVNPLVPRMSDVPQYIDEQQAYIMDPQARQADMDNVVGSPFIPEGLFIDEDGQTYMIRDTQSRSAASDQVMYEPQNQYLGEVAKDDKSRLQEEELKRSKEKLEQLEKQLKDIKTKVSLDDEKKEDKKDVTEGVKELQSDSTATTPDKKTEPPKKRNVFRQLGMHSS